QLNHRLGKSAFPIFLFQNVFLGGRQDTEFLSCVASDEAGVVKAVEEGRTDFELLLHQPNRNFLINRRLSLTTTFSVSGESLFQLVSQPQVIDNQTAGLVLKHAV